MLLVGAIRFATMTVQNERVVADLEPQALCYCVLPLFDPAVHELLHAAAVDADDMVVMSALIQLEYRHTPFEMMARDQPGGFELSKNPINRGKPDIFVGHQQLFVNILGAHVTRGTVRENVED